MKTMTPQEILEDIDPDSGGDYFHRSQVILMMKKYASEWVLKASKELNEAPRWEACTQSMLDKIKEE